MQDDHYKRKVLQEIFILKRVRHKNVIRLLEVFETDSNIMLVMELAEGGDLLSYVKKHGIVGER